MSSFPPDGFTARALRLEDAAGAAELLHEFDRAHVDEPTDELTAGDMRNWWRRYSFDRDSIGVFDEQLAAFGVLDERDGGALHLRAFVRPAFSGRGLGAFLLGWAERKAGSGTIRADIAAGDERARVLVGSRGYRHVRSGYRMVIDLEEPPPEAVWPEGLAVSTLEDGEERVLYEVMEEAFSEEWGRRPLSFDEWEQNIFGSPSFDPTLCFLVRTDDCAIAAEICQQRFGIGFVGSIGVLAPWRRRGLGRALLLHGFGELYQRGERRIGLGVDAENPTGATRLYEAVGMRVAWQVDTYEKAL